MKLSIQTPKKALKSLLKQKPLRSEIDIFKTNLIRLLGKVNEIEREENQKNHIRDFLRDTFYKDTNEINTKDSKDLVIHLGKTNKDKVGVIIEAKRPSNKSEMLSADKPNTKALQELVLYYLRERIEEKNIDIKYCIATNIYEWYIIETSYFETLFARNKPFIKEYEQWRDKQKVTSDTKLFYESIAKPFIDKIQDEIPCIYFDIRDYETVLRNDKKDDDKELIALFKILSPQYLLKTVTPNDSNSLNEKFYKELLHIIGLEEAKEGNKNIIRQKLDDKSNASFIEMAIKKLRTKGIHKVNDKKSFGETTDEQNFNIALELCITWINRILFLKLLEGQLLNYHKGNKDYCFLNIKNIHDFDELFTLFHSVLAVNVKDREPNIQQKYKLVPYLNSSLFEISELEDVTISIDNLDNSETLLFNSSSILKDTKSKNTGLNTLEYLFKFLDAYDFASEGAEDVQEENKTIINASVLGKVFEKINGYKDGSIYTPAFITMYMCKQSIRLSVVEKFNETKGWNVKEFAELYNKIEDKKEANQIINSIKICDPAVGSGHFLVSSLNELISIKSELNVLIDENGKTLRDYEIEIINDELIITDENNNIVAYNPQNKESNRVQKTLFHEKQTIIENCLFGVDINPNSVKICRLRLWIELLKNAYYKAETNYIELETLPNIDINIKCGNSLISRFKLDDNLSKALKSIKYDIKAYRGFVQDYKHEKNREAKRGLQIIIDTIKADFRTEFFNNDPKLKRLINLRAEYIKYFDTPLFRSTKLQEKGSYETKENFKKAQQKKEKLETEINKLSTEIDEIKTNAIYKNAFEWRFEFPEVLNNNGDFEGFDVIIANPPYVFARENFGTSMKNYFAANYQTSQYQVNLFLLFIERVIPILKKMGKFSMIIPNSLLMVSSAKTLRKHLLKETSLSEIINLLGHTFEGINVETIIIAGKKERQENNKISIYKNDGTDFILSHIKEQKIYEQNDGAELTVFSNSTNDELTLKLKKDADILDNLVKIKAGLKAYETGKGNPKQTTDDVKNRPFDYTKKINKNTYEYLEGKDVCRYQLKWSGGYLHYGEHLAAPRTFDIFNGKKIIIREITGKYPHSIIATYSEDIFLFNMSNIAIIEIEKSKVSLKYILAILNSKLMAHYFINNTAKSVRQLFPKLILEDLRKFPIKLISKELQQPFIALVDKILSAKQQGNETTTLEKQIDSLVYKLYSLTAQEINTIENN